MINPFKRIKNNSRYTYNNKTIIVEDVSLKGITFYYLLDWWEKQTKTPKYLFMKKWEFIRKVSNYKYI